MLKEPVDTADHAEIPWCHHAAAREDIDTTMIRHLALVFVFAIFQMCGCSPRIDRRALTNEIRQTDPEVKRFLDVFPDAALSLRTARGFGEVFPDPRDQIVTVRSELADGYGVRMSRSLHVEPDGVTYKATKNCTYHLESPSGGWIGLTAHQSDALLAARGDLGSLKPHGLDFGLPPMDVDEVIAGVRELYSPAAKLYETFPDTSWTHVDKPAYKQRGRFLSEVRLAEGVILNVKHEISVAADGVTVELVAEPNEGTTGHLSLYRAEVGPGGSSMKLTPDQFDRILAAKGEPLVIQQIWSERPRPKLKPKPSLDRDGISEVDESEN